MIDKINSIDPAALAPVLRYHLIPQTPIIHFQHAVPGSTLRATEVKPKLDKFLRKRAEEDGEALPKEFFIKETRALNYKLHLVETKRIGTYEVGPHTPYDIYYGNQGVDNESDKKKAVKSEVLMTVTCANKALRELIDKYVGEFFIVTNFGSMSGKGFGSFRIEEKSFSESEIAEALKRQTGSYNCFAFYGGDNPFKLIKLAYTVMKSGVSIPEKLHSLLFLYMKHENKVVIENEKDGLKARGLVPLHAPDHAPGVKYHYVRALLGVGDRAEYRLRGGVKFTISIKEKNQEIQRLASPIFFKVIDKRVYIVANRINEAIYGKVFTFTRINNGRSCEFSVPTKEMLNDQFIDDFLWCAVQEINDYLYDSEKYQNLYIEEVK